MSQGVLSMVLYKEKKKQKTQKPSSARWHLGKAKALIKMLLLAAQKTK